MKTMVTVLLLVVLVGGASVAWARGQKTPKPPDEDKSRPAAESVGFDADAATQVLVKSSSGGVQRITARESSDANQIGRIRATLRKIADDFAGYYVTEAMQAHGPASAALATLVTTEPGSLRTEYLEIRGGAEVRYTSDDPKIVAALHQWFASLSADRATDTPPAPNRSIMLTH